MADFASEAGHWYAQSGAPAYSIVGANGKERPTTLRDARGYQYAPGTTKILQVPAKPRLAQYKEEKFLLAGLATPRQEGEEEKDWFKRVREVAGQKLSEDANRGKEIHAAVAKFYAKAPVPAEMGVFVAGVDEAIVSTYGKLEWFPERPFVSPLGYGGAIDLHSESLLLDLKTKDGSLAKVEVFDEYLMQVAAYAKGLGGKRDCGIVFASRTHPGMVRITPLSSEEVERGWIMFRLLLAYWQTANNYRPAWAEPVFGEEGACKQGEL